MQNICNYLLETFDTNILNKQSKSIQLAFYSISKQYENTNKDNTLFRLIRNHYNKPKIRYNYLGGPEVLRRLYNKEYNINIYLFGEQHTKEIDCPKDNYTLIENFLYNIIQNTDVFIDLYFEIPGFSKDYRGYPKLNMLEEGRLQSLIDKFYKCIEIATRKNKDCQLSRIHYIDIRHMHGFGEYYGDILWLWEGLWKSIREVFIISNNERIKKILQKLITEDDNEFNKIWIDEIKNHTYIKKEIQKSFLGKKILQYSQKRLIYKANLKRAEIQRIIKIILKSKKLNLNNYMYLKELLTYPLTIIIDIYSLSRIFREFNVINKLNQPKKPHNIIYYAGSTHTLTMYNFLKTIDFTEIENVGNFYDEHYRQYIGNKNKYESCIDIQNIKQPFFSQQ